MENSRKINTIIIVLIVIIGILFYQNIKFSQQIEYIDNRVSNLNNAIYNNFIQTENSISNKVKAILNEEKNLIKDYKYTYKDVDTNKESVDTLIQFMIKQSVKNSKVYIMLSDQNSINEKEYECEYINGLYYACNIKLSYKDNYTINIYEKAEDGSSKLLNANSCHINVKEDFSNKTNITSFGIGNNKQKAQCSFSIFNRTLGVDDFKIKKIELKTYYNDQEVASKDITNYNILNFEALEHTKLKIASGQIEDTTIPENQYGTISEDEEHNEHGNYVIDILHSETGVEVKDNDYPEYTFKIIITLNNDETYVEER